MTTVPVHPELIRWAIDRSGLSEEELSRAFPRVEEWKQGDTLPTLKQLERFARKTRTPFGYLFLDKPPAETLPVPDFRTPGDVPIERPGPDLIDTLNEMERRQSWMREFVIEQGQSPLKMVGSLRQTTKCRHAAGRIRRDLGLDADWARREKTFEGALRTLRNSIEEAGILVAISGVVGNNTRRPLDPREFRGFVLCDDYAPLIFVNGNDSKSAQIFTLAHELVHVWLGTGGVFNLINGLPHDDATEQFCNRVAAEFLVPAEELRSRWKESSGNIRAVAREFKVSPIAAARQALDLNLITRDQFFRFYHEVQDEWQRHRAERKSGGDYYRTATMRLGRLFSRAVVVAAREGQILYSDAYSLTGMKAATFDRFAARVLGESRE